MCKERLLSTFTWHNGFAAECRCFVSHWFQPVLNVSHCETVWCACCLTVPLAYTLCMYTIREKSICNLSFTWIWIHKFKSHRFIFKSNSHFQKHKINKICVSYNLCWAIAGVLDIAFTQNLAVSRCKHY